MPFGMGSEQALGSARRWAGGMDPAVPGLFFRRAGCGASRLMPVRHGSIVGHADCC